MALRLIEVTLPRGAVPAATSLLRNFPLHGLWSHALDDDDAVLVRALVPGEQTETVTDVLSRRFHASPVFRVIVLTVAATVPEVDGTLGKGRGRRVSREELYGGISVGAQVSPVFLVTVVLSALVAALGLIRDDVAIIIGAMVIAPLLGPNMALALAVTLGDPPLLRTALKAKAYSLALVAAFALAVGFLWGVDPSVDAISARTVVSPTHVLLALAAGAAGAIAFTSGIPAALIGVMVAVALLPPLATAGLLLGAGYLPEAAGAALLYAVNVVCVNLSAIVTFVVQGVRPRVWWDAERAQRATRRAVMLWTILLILLLGLILLYARLRGVG